MNSVVSILFFLTFIAMGLVFCDITQDDLQSVTFDGQGINNNSLNIEALFQLNRAKEVELERAQRVNRKFEKMIQLVNILGQVDSFLSERTKLVLRKLALLADDDDNYYRRRRS